MERLWPPQVHNDEHGDYSPQAELPVGLTQASCLPRQALHLDPQPEGWKIVIDSSIETGRVEVFIPQNREAPARIVSDTRVQSQSRPVDQLLSGGHYSEAAVAAERELQTARDAAADKVTVLEKLRQLVLASFKSGDFQRTESAVNEALAICESSPAEFAEVQIPLLHTRALAHYLYGCTDEESTVDVRRELSRARQRAEQLLGREHPETARIMTSLARLLISEFSYPEAEELLTEALRIQRSVLGDDHLYVAESLLELARLNAYRENHEAADEGFQQAIAIRETRCGPEHPDVAEALFHYTDFLMYNVRDVAAAGSKLRRALAIWNETIGLNHTTVVRESGFIRKVLSVDADAGTVAASVES